MKSSIRDKIEGKMHQVKGKIKNAVGRGTNNRKLEVDGKTETFDGKFQQKIGWLKHLVKK
jgi:uncharacterized protein YjbJ (UPF0337 family)